MMEPFGLYASLKNYKFQVVSINTLSFDE